jgi:DNA-binding IclR family transcriptional regulator
MRNSDLDDMAVEPRPSSIEKAIDILFCFDAEHPELRLTDISAKLGLHKSTAYRLLSLLKKKGLIVTGPNSQLYSLGPGLVELAWVVLRQQDLRSTCHPYLERLRQATNETVNLTTRLGDQRVCVDELESEQNIKYSQTVGLTAPLHVGAPGKALMAFLPESELNTLLDELPLTAITPSTLSDPERLRTELSVVQTRGFSISIGERSPGASAVAAPIWNWSGRPVAAISVLGPAQRLTYEKLQELGPEVMRVAQEISAALGYVPPASAAIGEAPLTVKRR